MERTDVTEAIRLLSLIHDEADFVEPGDQDVVFEAIQALIDIEDELSPALE